MSTNYYSTEFINKCVPEHLPAKVPWIAKHYEEYEKARLQHESYKEQFYAINDKIKGRPQQENGEKIKRHPKEKAPGFLSKLPEIVQGETVRVVTKEYHSFIEDFENFYDVSLDDARRNIYAEALKVLVKTINFKNHRETYKHLISLETEVETLKQRQRHQDKKKVDQQPEAPQRRPRQSQAKSKASNANQRAENPEVEAPQERQRHQDKKKVDEQPEAPQRRPRQSQAKNKASNANQRAQPVDIETECETLQQYSRHSQTKKKAVKNRQPEIDSEADRQLEAPHRRQTEDHHPAEIGLDIESEPESLQQYSRQSRAAQRRRRDVQLAEKIFL